MVVSLGRWHSGDGTECPDRRDSREGGTCMETDSTIAYFSMEIALDVGMPTYSGGLGVLAGDTIRAAADLSIPMVAQKTLRLPRCLRRGGMSDLGSGLDARCQDQLEGLQWRHGPPTHTPCRLRYPVPLGLVAHVPARRVARRDTTTGAGALCRYCGAV